jgi:PAS domain S-box-containing protein
MELGKVKFRESLMFFEQVLMAVPCAIFWKDRESRFLGCNTLFLQLGSLRSLEEIIGKTDFEMPWSNRAEHYQRIDRMVLGSGKIISCHEIVSTTHGDLQVKTTKSPLIKDGEIIGTVGMFQDISDLVTALESAEAALNAKNFAERESLQKTLDLQCVLNDITEHRYYLAGKYRGVYLTRREAECLVCLSRGLTNKETAKLLKISHRTTEGYIQAVKQKFNCHTRSALIKEAIACSFLEGIKPSIPV